MSLRGQQSRRIVQTIHDWLTTQVVLPQSALGRSIAYTLELWPGLVRFLENPDISLHNNGAERAMRGVVRGRKNHYGSKSLRGTQVAALFYSLGNPPSSLALSLQPISSR